MKTFEAVASLFLINPKVRMTQSLFFLNLNYAAEYAQNFVCSIDRNHFCLLISLYWEELYVLI